MQNLTLAQILEKGTSGGVPNLTVEQWKLLYVLISENGENQYQKGLRDGIKAERRAQQDFENGGDGCEEGDG